MQLPAGKYRRTDIWREGKYLDLWSVVHLLSGASVGLALHLFQFELKSAAIIAFLLLVAYEMFEVIIKVEETKMNRVLDVVVGMISFAPAFLTASFLSRNEVWVAFAAITAVSSVLGIFGWIASQKALAFERQVQSRFYEQRERMRARRALFKKNMLERRKEWRARKGLKTGVDSSRPFPPDLPKE